MSGSARGVNSQGYRGQSFSRGQWLNQAPRRWLRQECGLILSNVGLTITEGKLNGMQVKVLRDTGCTCVVVNRKLIKDKMLTG